MKKTTFSSIVGEHLYIVESSNGRTTVSGTVYLGSSPGSTAMDIFAGAATLATGGIAWLIYIINRKVAKKEAAIILLNEIESAEREINTIKINRDINDYTSILPFSHWNDFQHLFVKDFDASELSKINNFFKSCKLAEESIRLYSSYLVNAMEEKSRIIQVKLLDLMEKTPNAAQYEVEKNRILSIFHSESYYFVPHTPKQKLFDYLDNLNEISLTIIGIKFKKIIHRKWYQF